MGNLLENHGKNHGKYLGCHHFVFNDVPTIFPLGTFNERRHGQREDETEWLETGVFADVREPSGRLKFGSVMDFQTGERSVLCGCFQDSGFDSGKFLGSRFTTIPKSC